MIINKHAKREAKQLLRLCQMHGLLDEGRVRRVVQDVVVAGQRDGPGILAHFRRLVRLDRAQHTAYVESATPLPSYLQAAIEAGLTRRYGPGLTAAFAQRGSLIGGVRIQVGCDVYDDSVLASLATFEKAFEAR